MKKLLILFFAFTTLLSCSNDESDSNNNNESIIGRWHLVGFEDTVMYDFKDNLRYTIYSTNGEFGPTETSAIPNPNDWYIEDGKIHIDLNFGNINIKTLNFRCNGYVVDFVNDNGDVAETLFREGYDYTNCNN